MKVNTCGLILVVIYVATRCEAEKVCAKVPTIKITECCKLPEFADVKLITEVAKSVENEADDYMKICKFKEAIFKKLNLIKNDDVDKAASLKYIETQITDSDWKPVAKKAFEACYTEMEPQYAEIQKRSNFTKAQCNIKYDALTECINIASFEGCPKKAWTEKTECTEAKKFVGDCHKDFEAMEKFCISQNS